MKTLSCMVVDDEPLAVQLLESYVSRTPFLDLKGAYENGVQAFRALQEEHVDLLFCDIQMPGLSGMELSRMLPEGTKIIFTTAFSQYALEGFKVSALDYLLKPISYPDFLASAKKALEWFEHACAPSTNTDERKSIFVKTEYRLQQVLLDDILFIEGMKDYVKIHLENGEQVVSLTTLKSLSEQLPDERFFRVAKSYIVQMDKVKAIERGRIVFGQTRIPISEQSRDEFFRLLSRFSILPEDK